MKKQVFGRRAGSQEPMVLLLESGGVSTDGRRDIAPGVIEEYAVANARRQIELLRKKNIEGYVLFENDPTRYEFSPNADFVYPADTH